MYKGQGCGSTPAAVTHLVQVWQVMERPDTVQQLPQPLEGMYTSHAMLFGLLAVTAREPHGAESKLMIFHTEKPGVKEGSVKLTAHTRWLSPNSLESKDRWEVLAQVKLP